MSVMPIGRAPARSTDSPAPRRQDSSSSDSSVVSQVGNDRSVEPDGPTWRRAHPSSIEARAGAIGSQNFSRPTATRVQFYTPSSGSTSPGPPGHTRPHPSPQHAQGFFEPGLSRTNPPGQPLGVTVSASQAAAQAAMQHQSAQQQARQRSQTVPSPQSPVDRSMAAAFGKPPTPVHGSSGLNIAHPPGLLKRSSDQDASPGGYTATAATAASAAYPRSMSTAGLPPSDRALPGPLEKEHKTKAERPKMKLFSKPKSIAISRDKDLERRDRPLPSPNKMGIYGPSPLPQMYTASTTTLTDAATLGPTSGIYLAGNRSTAPLLSPEDVNPASEKPKHHFLSRQKLKLRDKDDARHHLPSSSATSGSTAAQSNPAQASHIFPPSSPGYTATSFARTVSGLDILHGGRALREKKREEKASAPGPAAAARPRPPRPRRPEMKILSTPRATGQVHCTRVGVVLPPPTLVHPNPRLSPLPAPVVLAWSTARPRPTYRVRAGQA